MTDQVFVSKIDLWLPPVMFGALLLSTGLFVLTPMSHAAHGFGLFSLLVATAFAVWLFCDTRYIVTRDHLLVRCGPIRQSILLMDIRAVSATRNPLSSPALSLDRLRIDCDARGAVMISPKDRPGFVAALRARGINLAPLQL